MPKLTVEELNNMFLQNKRVKPGTWENKENHKTYAIWLGEKLNYETIEDWYEITQKDIKSNRGLGLLSSYYNGSTLQFLKSVFPQERWLPWKFTVAPANTWKYKQTHKDYAIWLGEKLNYEKTEDWYKITANDIHSNRGDGLLKNYYNDSPLQFLKSVFPQERWLPWKFTKCSNIWKDKQIRKDYAIWLGEELNYKNMEDWYKITQNDIHSNRGGGLLGNYYNDSPLQFLKSVFPQERWLPWKFTKCSNIWKDKQIRKDYAIWLREELNYKNMEDWYKITANDINSNHGCGLLCHYYNGSPLQFLKSVFPQERWLPWKFTVAPTNTWKDKQIRKDYAIWLGEELNYKNMEDWYKITLKDINSNRGCGLLCDYYNGSPSQFLKSVFPHYPWDLSKFKKKYSQGQIEWLNYLSSEKYPDIRHILNHDDGEYSIPNSRYHADGYSKATNTVFEYHGDMFHGNPAIYEKDAINPISKITYGELYEKTIKKQRFCEESDYKYVFIWESEWFRAKTSVIKLQRKWKKYKV